MCVFQVEEAENGLLWVKYYAPQKGLFTLSDVRYVIKRTEVVKVLESPSLHPVGRRFYFK